MDVKLKLFVNITADEITSHILEDNSVKIYKVEGEKISSLTEWYYFPAKILEVIEIWGNYLFLCENQGLFHVKYSKIAIKMRKSCKTPTLIPGTNLVIGFKCPVTITVLQNGVATCCKSEKYWEVVKHFFRTNSNSDVLFEDTPQLLAKFKHRKDIESTPILKTISTNTLSERLFSKLFMSANAEEGEVIIIALPDSRVFYFPSNQDGAINPKLLCCLNQPVKDVFVYNFHSPDVGNPSTSQALVVVGVHGRVVLFTDEDKISGVLVEFLHIPSPVVHITPSCHGIVSYDGETLWKTVIKKEKSTDKKQRIFKHHVKISAPKFLTFATISTNKNKEVDNSVFIVREDFNLQMCTLEAANCETTKCESNITDGLTIENLLSEIHLCSNTLESLIEQQDKQKRLLEEISNAAQFFHNRHQAASYFASSCEACLESRDNSIYLILRVNITNKGPIALIGPNWHLIVAVSPSGTNKTQCHTDQISVITKTCPLLSGFGIQETLRSHIVQMISSVRSLCSQLPINVSCYLQYSVPKDHTFCSKDSERVSLFLVQISSRSVDALDFTRSSKQIANQPEFNRNTGGLGKCLENIAQEYRAGKISLKAPAKIGSRSVPRTICTCLTFRKHTSCLNFNCQHPNSGIGTAEYFKQAFRKLKQDSREDKEARETVFKYMDHLFGYEFQIQVADYGNLFGVEIHCPANMLSLMTKTVASRLQVPCKSCRFDAHVPARCLSRSKELRTCLGRLSIVLQENETHSQELLIQLYEDLRKNVSSLLPTV